MDKLFLNSLFQSHFISVLSKFFKQTHKYREVQTVYTNIVHVQTQKDRPTRTHNYTYTYKAPFRTRAYTDIKGSLFSPSYRYSTDALCCEHIYVYCTVCFMSASVCETTMYGGELLQTPLAPRAGCHMGLCACALWFVFV